ncbi:uncharacterized protein [Manis javanica]|uniref:uncharacterized protein n=1 Tax=Manis javanica TaxID=9974 RepID=UPI003C6D3D7B
MTSLYLLTLLLTLETPTQGVLRWGILSAFPKPMPVHFNAAVFPRFFTTNSSMNLPYLVKDTLVAPLGENRSFVTNGSLCFTTQNLAGCISLKRRKYGWFSDIILEASSLPVMSAKFEGPNKEGSPSYKNMTIHQMVLWINGTFVHSPRNNSTDRPRQPKYASHCVGDYEGELWPWTDCQSTVVTWATERQEFTISPDMEGRPANEAWWPVKVLEGEFRQQLSMNPFHKWMLCGVNGSCTDLSPFSALQGGGIGVKNITFWCENNHMRAHWNMIMTHNNENYTCSAKSGPESPNSLFPPSPVCVYPPFLFILSNSSFDSCSNETCFLSQCWDARNFTNALVVRIPRWVPVPVDAPNTMTLFRERRDFGVTAAIVLLISATAVAATAAGIALDTSIKSATELNNLAASVASALDQQSTLDGKLKGGIMILNQRIDLVEEQMEVLWQMAQLGCERKYRALCITSIQYKNFTRAANLSRNLSQYLSGNWSQDFDGTLEELRREIIHINSTRLDISVAEGLSSWFLRALSHVKEWAGMAGMGVFLLGGLMLLLWLLCRLRNQHKQDKVILAQALMEIDVSASPQVWLNMLKKEARL